jgi:DNA-binding beta-propeller fold protein YncE
MRPIPRIGWFLLFIVGLNSPLYAQGGIITTYAGPGMPVNGELATNLAFAQPASVVPDGAGGFYFTSWGQNFVFRVSVDGVINTVAGGVTGALGDGGPATSAGLNYPRGIAVDKAGNLFIADVSNSRIRKVTPFG